MKGGSDSGRAGAPIVAGLAVLAVVIIAAVAMLRVPGNEHNSDQMVTIATAAFGVLGGVAGSFFAVRAADRGIEQVARQVERRESGQDG